MSSAIETRGLTVAFGTVPGVLDLDLRVAAGEVFGFLGPNGAGKTTTIRLLLDLLRPDRGEALVFGREVRAAGSSFRADIGFLPGDLALFPGLSGRQTLELFAGLSRRPSRRRDEVLGRLGFPENALDRKVRTYSTGMRQMIGITAAFQHDPALLILDEPTTGLDPMVREAFLGLVRDRRAAGQTVFLSSHVLDEIERCADRVGLVHSSRLRLVESVKVLRESRPRHVVCRYTDGREVRFTHAGAAAEILDRVDRNGLADLEVRPASLDEVFRAVVREESGG